jgi:hypothetical protein
VRTTYLDDNCCAAFHRNVNMIVWGKQTLPGTVERCSLALSELGRAHPGGLGMITIVEPDSELPSPEARSALAKLLHDAGTYNVKRSAVAQEGEGFRAAAVRGVVTGLSLLAKHPYPHQLFTNVETALAWLVAGLPPDSAGVPTEVELLAAVHEMRRAFDERRRESR